MIRPHVAATFLVLLLASSALTAQFRDLEEFHYGFGGFSIRAGYPTSSPAIAFQLDEYQAWGHAFLWEKEDFRLRVSVCFAAKGKKSIENTEKNAVIARWKGQLVSELGSKTTIQEKPYLFEGFQGIEIATTSPKLSITRLFFLKTLLIEETIVVDKNNDLAQARQILDTFRLLNKTERTIAMIAEFTPPLLAQEPPDRLPKSDSTEQGILGPVRRIRDTFQPISKKESVVVQETHFNQDGFIAVEVGFNQGLPDIITTWGWVDGKRVNLQSAVNYPYDGPFGSRTAVLSGSLTIPGLAKTPNESKYGNLIETKWDDRGRPVERRRFTSSGSLVYIEQFIYDGNRYIVKTVDESGGFIGTVRNRVDPNNNLLETETLFDNGSVANSTRFEYQFDNKGNWIVKKAFSKAGTGRNSVPKLIGTYYRDISYYESHDLRQVG